MVEPQQDAMHRLLFDEADDNYDKDLIQFYMSNMSS